MADVPPGLVAWARLPGPSAVLDAVRKRARRGARTETGVLRVTLTPAQRREVARVLGISWEVSGGPVRLQDLAGALGEHGFAVRDFVEALDGAPLDDHRLLRAERRASITEERSAAGALLARAGVEPVHAEAWLSDPGIPRAGAGELVALTGRVVQVWRELPGAPGPPTRLARLAATVLGDAHALDYREELGRAVSRLIAVVHGLPRPVRPGRDWRRAWAAVGVVCDEVSSRVLVLNLPLSGDAPAARWSAAVPGEPLWLTLRSISGAWSAPPGTWVFVCENPTVLETAADELGPGCPPLVCTDGNPSLAALDLIGGLAAAGCVVRVRADVDSAGFVVVAQVRTVAPNATTWRFDVPTYCRHLRLTGVPDPTGDEEARLGALRDLYAARQVPLHEETLLDELLGDLALACR